MRNFINYLLKKANIFILYRYGMAIGDYVCMTAIIEKIVEKKSSRLIVFSNYLELFENNPKVWKKFSLKNDKKIIQKLIISFLKRVEGEQIERFAFISKNNLSLEEYMKTTKSKISLIQAHSLHFHKKLDLNGAKPKIYFSDDELVIFENKFKILSNNFAVVQPVGKTTYTPNKEWGFEKYQEVINSTKDTINWLQIGFGSDKLLENVIDLRGKTNSLRELAYVISKANFVFANEGLINHLSASVDTKSFIIFSGFHPIEIAKYDTTTAIYKKVDCSPCWLLEKCPKEKKICTENILIEDVLNVIKNRDINL